MQTTSELYPNMLHSIVFDMYKQSPICAVASVFNTAHYSRSRLYCADSKWVMTMTLHSGP